ncbi:hypothetical protein QJU89_05830 [Pasteurella skyensis]|uniref:Phage major capsid protein E n=1 Tax=Phocoenobacter skyensis TaxID=97481 RepID=A0AAJ6N9C2_9PAST|nr:hypothetical protein [Pasteurella skyensis]MDP8162810.1 hypothetical protein [Pasteurella skyensis]MDP8172603.1 hypothetical protein [Pasteurella skyensis]MDP8179103.1 hypothetical protein [Pasteurella skyensis]MDP8183212.1 hypothetical protein [Pasteurella skyensis]MDP8189263.1 hypothetical protein [Pasteurella skyensis]
MAGQKVHTRLTDPVLTQFALGYHNGAFVGDKLLPFAEIPKEGARLPTFGNEAFVAEEDERELHAPSNKITPVKVTSKTIEVVEHDLAHPIDYRENKEADFAYEQYAIEVVREKMALNHEKRIQRLVSNESIYGSNNKIVLSGTSQFSNANSDMFDVFDDAFEKVRIQAGVAVNQMIIPSNVWAVMRKHEKVMEVLKRRGLQRLTPTILAEMLKDDDQDLTISIGRAIYRASLNEDPTAIWANDIVMGYVPKAGADGKHKKYKPSFGYTYRRKGSLVVDKYDEVGGKVYNVRCTDIHKEYILMPSSGFLIKAAV